MPGFRDQRTQQLSLSLPENWNTIRMPIAITTDIITMAIADTITVQIITATGIEIWLLCLFRWPLMTGSSS